MDRVFREPVIILGSTRGNFTKWPPHSLTNVTRLSPYDVCSL